MDVRRFRSSRMLLPKIPMLPAYRHAKHVGRFAGVAFLLVTFLWPFKEKGLARKRETP